MVHPNRDEILVAQTVKASYDRQVADGIEEPLLYDSMAELTQGVGGIWKEELGRLGLGIRTYSLEGPTYIEPIESTVEQEQ